MKANKTIILTMLFFVATALSFSETITLKLGDGSDYKVDLPTDVAGLVNQNKAQIESALKTYNVTKEQLDTATSEVNKVYKDMEMNFAPLTTVTNGLDNFSEDLSKAISNAQLMQNVWAEAWVGKLVPGFHMGFGVNVGAGEMKIDALKDAAIALGIDEIDDLPKSFAFPTIAADIRLGGIILPFDIGVSYMTIDSSKISALDEIISPVMFDFFTLGIDARWALCQGKGRAPKISLGAGFVLTKGDVEIENDYANAGLDFTSKNFYVQAQFSKKLLFIVPFVGAKVSFVKASVDWNANAQWKNILNGNEGQLGDLQNWGILPTRFEGGYEGSYIVPQVFGGIGFDLFIINLNFAAGYDIKNKLLSAAVNFRIAW